MKRLMKKRLTKELTKRKKARGHERGDRERGKNGRTKKTLAETRLTSLTFLKKEGEGEGKSLLNRPNGHSVLRAVDEGRLGYQKNSLRKCKVSTLLETPIYRAHGPRNSKRRINLHR